MKPNLYICHTAYQVLVDLLRASRTDGQPHTMVLSAAVPEPQSLAKKLEATGAVKVVIVDETRWPGTVTGPFAARRARRAFERLCGWRFTRAAYNEVRMPGISCAKTPSPAPSAPTSTLSPTSAPPPILPGSGAPEKATFTGATARGAQKWKARMPRNARCSPPAA